MKIGINACAFPDKLTVPQGLKLAKRAGFANLHAGESMKRIFKGAS